MYCEHSWRKSWKLTLFIIFLFPVYNSDFVCHLMVPSCVNVVLAEVCDFSCSYRNDQHPINHVLCSQLRKDWNLFLLLFFLCPVYRTSLICKHGSFMCGRNPLKNKHFCQNNIHFTVNGLHWGKYLLLPPHAVLPMCSSHLLLICTVHNCICWPCSLWMWCNRVPSHQHWVQYSSQLW